MRRRIAPLLATVLAAMLALGAGFAWFSADATRVPALPGGADGIVVLAGGEQRVETGLALLRAGIAPRLLVSGVGPGVTVADLLQATWPGAADRDATAAHRQAVAAFGPARLTPDRVTLGHRARTTVGNARETAAWMRANGLRSVVVVTAGYHMRRALAELRTALPDAEFEPYPVHPAASLRLLVVEYLKLVAVEFDLRRSPHLAELT